MDTVYSDAHAVHHASGELISGEFKPAFEMPQRAYNVIDAVREAGLGEIREPEKHGSAPATRVHTERMVRFLETAWDEWVAKRGEIDAFPLIWPSRSLRDIEPNDIDGKLGFYCADAGTPITAGTWPCVSAGVDVAVTAADMVLNGADSAFAATRPPGHHAGKEIFLGYCYLNFTAIAAQHLIDAGKKKVAILDVDYHHGNGTQDIFYDRDDVLFVSLHADPMEVFPFFAGHADETGTGAGEGYNVNLPLPLGATWDSHYAEALDRGIEAVKDFDPDILIVSLGVDTYEHDPIGQICLKREDYARIGKALKGINKPTLFMLEGGYMVDHVGVNVIDVLKAFDAATE